MPFLVYGQYPRSEALVRATRDYDRKRINDGLLQFQFQEDRRALKALQEGLPFFSSGLFHWDDLMRPFTELIVQCYAGPLTRFFETNLFWRRIEIEGPYRLREGILNRWIKKYFFPGSTGSPEQPAVFTLPFLFLFQAFSKGMTFFEIEHLLECIVMEIDAHYRGIVIFLEPFFGWEALDLEQKQRAAAFLERLKLRTSIFLGLVPCFSSVEKEMEFLFSLPADMIGIDFFRNRLAALPPTIPEGKSLLAGVISTESTALEQKEHLVRFLNEAKKHFPRNKIVFTTSGPAELLPRVIMDQKISHVKEVAVGA